MQKSHEVPETSVAEFATVGQKMRERRTGGLRGDLPKGYSDVKAQRPVDFVQLCRSAGAGRRNAGSVRLGARGMDAFRQEAEDSCLQFCSDPTVQQFAEIKLPFSIDNLIGLLRANERNIFSLANKRAIDPLTLRTQLLLHLPRLFTTDRLPSGHDIQQDILAVSDFVEDRQRPYARWLKPPERPIALSDLEFISLDAETAKVYHECFHYVGSFRPGEHFAFRVKDSDRVVCIGSIAGFDLKHAEEKIAPYVDPRSVSVFSRFFTFRWAPQNTFSYFWGKLRRQLREERDTKLMFSFINPNIGFNACSHKAAQWKLFAQEAGTNYMYLDGRYRTMRFFVENYGMNDADKLKEKLGNSFEVSTMKLHPVQLLAIPLQRWAQKLIPAYPYQFQRPVLARAHINPPQALQAAE